MYDEAIVQPALKEPVGVARVLRFVDLYLDYLRDGPFPGGCFFIAASIDPARNRGPVKAALAASQKELLDFFAEEIATAQTLGEVPAGVAPQDLAFAVDALLAGADLNFLLFDDPRYLELAKDAVRRTLTTAVSAPQAVTSSSRRPTKRAAPTSR